MSDKVRQWGVVITTAISTGGAAGLAASHGGCSAGYSFIVGLVAAASAVGHVFLDSPNKKQP